MKACVSRIGSKRNRISENRVKRITAENHMTDQYYGKVVAAVRTLLEKDRVVKPVDVFVKLDLLKPQHLTDWRAGRVPYLEKVIQCNLGKTSRILRILRLHAHDLKLHESITVYKHRSHLLRFSKTHEPKIEEAYSRHFIGQMVRSPRFERGNGQV